MAFMVSRFQGGQGVSRHGRCPSELGVLDPAVSKQAKPHDPVAVSSECLQVAVPVHAIWLGPWAEQPHASARQPDTLRFVSVRN